MLEQATINSLKPKEKSGISTKKKKRYKEELGNFRTEKIQLK